MYRFSDFELDERRHELRCFGREARGVVVRLAPQPFRLLLALVAAKGALVTREELGRRLWDEGTFVDAEAGINFCVRTLRRALAEASGLEAPIETVPRLGYRLSVAVSETSDEGRAAPVAAHPVAPASIPSASSPSPSSSPAWTPEAPSGAFAPALGPADPGTVRAGRAVRARAIGLAAVLAAAVAVVGLALSASRSAESRGETLAVAVTGDGRPDGDAIARAFEAELVAALVDGAAGRGELLVDSSKAPEGAAHADARLEARIFEIPSGFRGEFRLLRGTARAIAWQWTVELSPDRWFYVRSTIAEGVGREVVSRLWPHGGHPPPASVTPADSELAATVERARRTLDDGAAGAGERALAELRPIAERSATSAEALAVESRARLALWERAAAERTARRALELDSDNAEATWVLALALSAQGRHAQAVEAAYRARKLAPLAPWAHSGLARVLLFAGRPGEVVGVSDAGLALHPELMQLWRWRYLAELERGDFARAGDALARVARLSWGAGLPLESERALAEGATQDTLRAEWRAELAGAYGAPPATAASRAALHALLGESDAALAEIERSIAEREEPALFFAVAPWFARLRGDARFQALVRRVEEVGRG